MKSLSNVETPMWQRTKHLEKGERDLLWASANGDTNMLKDLVATSNIKAHDSLKMTALHFACRHGHGAICRILLAHGADPDARDDKGVCPLHFAAYHGHFDCIAALCEGKANLTIQEGDRPHGATPLFRAAGHGNVDVIKLLLQHGAPVSTDPSFPVHAAASEGRLEALRLLLASGGDLHQLDDEGWSLLDCAGYEGHTECMWALLELGAKPVAHVCYLRPFLREAIEARDDDAVRLLCVGTGIGGYQKVPPTKVLAVHVSVQKGFLEVTEALMEAECPGKPWIDARLLAAAAHGDRKRIEAFVLLGADVNVSTTHNADTPLHLACSSPGDRVACVKLLLQYGAVVGKKDKKNSTPLHIAAARADLLMMKVLLEAGADPVAVDDGGESCLYKACATGSVAAVKLLLNGSEGAVGSASNGLIDLDSSFPLHFVAQNGSVVVLRAMLEAGKCNVNALNKAKETPLDCACAAEVVSNAQILLLAGGTATKSHPFLYKLLESAIDRGAVDEVHALIKGGLDVTRKKMGGSGRYALQAAVEKGNLEISELLADAGCRFDTKLGKNNKTPFMIAVDKNHIEIAKLAVKKGVGLDSEAILSWIWSCAAAGLSVAVSLCSDLGLDPNKAPFVAKSGETALHAAATAGQRDWVRDFVRVGANVNAVDGNGCTPIMVAALAGKMDVCKVLLEEGECELDHISKNGLQLIHILADAGKEDTLEIVLDLNPELVDVPNLHEETPLMLAVKKSREGAVRLLLDRRANLFARNKQGKVAATMTKNKAIKRMLADREAEIAAEEAEAEEQEEEEEDGQSEGEAEGEEEEVEEAEKDDDGGNQSEEDKIVVAEPAPHVQESKAQRKKRRRAEALAQLTATGLTTEQAIWTLDACNGNLDVALESARAVSEGKKTAASKGVKNKPVESKSEVKDSGPPPGKSTISNIPNNSKSANSKSKGKELADAAAKMDQSFYAPASLSFAVPQSSLPSSDLMFLWDEQRHQSPLSSLFGPLFGGGSSGGADGVSDQSSMLGSSLFGTSLFPSEEGVQRLRAWLAERGVSEAANDLIQMDEVTSPEELLEWDVARMRASSLAAPLRRKVWNVIVANKTKK